MKELLEKIWRAIRHNQGLVIANIIVLSLVVWTYGCESKVSSLNNPNVLVTRAELEVEIETFMQTADIRVKDLDRQEALKLKLFEFAAAAAESGTVNQTNILGLTAWILFGGALLDNRRKDGVIKGKNTKVE